MMEKCGCCLGMDRDRKTVILYCELHEAASSMADALRKIASGMHDANYPASWQGGETLSLEERMWRRAQEIAAAALLPPTPRKECQR